MVFFRSFSIHTVGAIGLAVLLPLIAGCTQEPEDHCLILAASIDHLGAEVTIDGTAAGNLKRQRVAARLLDKFIPQPDFFPKEVVSLSVDVSNLPEGLHVVRVVNAGQELISRDFSVPLSEDILLFVEPVAESE